MYGTVKKRNAKKFAVYRNDTTPPPTESLQSVFTCVRYL